MEKVADKKSSGKKPLMVAMVGLVGSGKTAVSREIARHIRAEVIDGDAIRAALRAMKKNYAGARNIAEYVATETVRRGRNVVLASDFVDAEKRKSLEKKARQLGARVLYVRTVCDRDVLVGRIISAHYKNDASDFFGGAGTSWRGNQKYRGAVVKLREMWRRTPHHYQWVNKEGGVWELKKLPIKFFAVIDTTDPKKWKAAVKKVSQKIKRI